MTQTLTTYFKLCTEFYDLEVVEQDSQIEAFYCEQARYANGPILEPMCGTGRFLIPLLLAGFDAEGFDASAHMLDACKQKCAQLGIAAPIWQQFVQEFGNDKKYSMIFVPYGSWGLITNREESFQGLQAMLVHLEIGGKLFLEIETIDSVSHPLDVWRDRTQVREDGSLLVLNVLPSYNPEIQLFTAQCRYESINDGVILETETETFEQYLYRFDEMDELLKQVGFTNIKKYQDYEQRPAITPAVHTIIYECSK